MADITPLLQLENALTKTENIVELLHSFLSNKDEATKPVDAFLGGIYEKLPNYTEDNPDRPLDIDSQLRGIYLTLDKLLSDNNLTGYLHDTYQSLPDGGKTDYFIYRIGVAIETCNMLFDRTMHIESQIKEFASHIKRAKTTPEHIDALIERTEDMSKHRYIERMPKTLHIAKRIIWFIPRIRALVAYVAGHLLYFKLDCYNDGSQTELDKSDSPQTFEKFEELFDSPQILNECVDALRRYRPEKPVIGEGLNWIGSTKDRGLMVAWIERMERTKIPKIKHLTNRKKLVKLLNAYFHGLDMGVGASVFNNSVDVKVSDAFKALIPE